MGLLERTRWHSRLRLSAKSACGHLVVDTDCHLATFKNGGSKVSITPSYYCDSVIFGMRYLHDFHSLRFLASVTQQLYASQASPRAQFTKIPATCDGASEERASSLCPDH